jgi:hypothetical protein
VVEKETEIEVVEERVVVLAGAVKGVPREGGVGVEGRRPEARSWAISGFSGSGGAG